MSEPMWVVEGRKHLGLPEIAGPNHSPVIQSWLHKLRAWWNDDETPWCGVYVAACFDTCGFSLPKYWMRAKAWADWGLPLVIPVPGCVVIFDRQGGGHVGFVVGQDVRGRLMVLGGNQGNKVSIAAFDRSRVLGYRWPMEADPRNWVAAPLPMMAFAGDSSKNEV